MSLLPTFVVNRILPLLSPVRRAMLNGWIREDVFDFYGRLLHPQLHLRRVFARVIARRLSGDATVVLTLAPSRNWAGVQAGQHIGVSIEHNGIRHTRRYSPTAITANTLEIAVKRLSGGEVSNLLHDAVKVGDYLELDAAQGDFVLAATVQPKLLLLAAGAGITPVISLVRQLIACKYAGDIDLLYYGHTRENLAFVDELNALASTKLRVHILITGSTDSQPAPATRITGEQLAALVPDAADRHAYACGSHGFVTACDRALTHVGGQLHIHEAFSPPTWSFEDDQPVTLTLARSRQEKAARTGGTLLTQLEAMGLKPASGCRMGICNTCSCKKNSGAVRDLRTGLVSTEPNDTIRLCISAPVGDVNLEL
ncbi:iron-sulfur cluster-binding domain-containing protein [Burkholderiaceae bacterium DAT-1]|nr:iron-sulfur cluster-binding domain-containing protein [Burkholderiaceae bacterium DAT-1]